MIFQNYSQTYAAAITTLVGMVTSVMAIFGWDFVGNADIQFVAGTVANFVGIVWAIVHRNRQGDVTVAGFRKDVSAS